MDMNGLKSINDNHGHRVGDAALTEFASRIKCNARRSDIVARLGGDEFGMILSPVDSSHGVTATIARLNSQIEPPFLFEGKTYRLHASIGAALFPEDGEDIKQLIDVADHRMYAEKRAHHQRAAS